MVYIVFIIVLLLILIKFCFVKILKSNYQITLSNYYLIITNLAAADIVLSSTVDIFAIAGKFNQTN